MVDRQRAASRKGGRCQVGTEKKRKREKEVNRTVGSQWEDNRMPGKVQEEELLNPIPFANITIEKSNTIYQKFVCRHMYRLEFTLQCILKKTSK